MRRSVRVQPNRRDIVYRASKISTDKIIEGDWMAGVGRGGEGRGETERCKVG